MSHTKDDKEFCDMFDVACARVGVKAFRSEFETIEIPQWKTIKEAMNKSIAMFLLVGRELTTHQAYQTPDWKYTQNWIAYETGLACQRGIDVWVLSDEGIKINFPVPYFNNYAPFGLRTKENFEFIKTILTNYGVGNKFPTPLGDRFVTCPYDNCGAEFNLHARLNPGEIVTCPQCLRDIQFKQGFLLDLS